MKGFLNHIWNAYKIDKILLVKKGVFLVRFVHLYDKNLGKKKGFYYFDNKPLLVNSWNPSMDLQTERIKSLPLWVLRKIGSILGIPIKTDKYTKEKMGIRYARMLIEMAIGGPFSEFVEFLNEKRILTASPLKCNHYAMLGHSGVVYKKKGVLRKDWRLVQQDNSAAAGTTTQLDPPLDGGSIGDTHTTPTDFTPVPRRSQAKQLRASSPERGQSPAYNASHQNSFHALFEGLHLQLLQEGPNLIPPSPLHD
ncbi:LOW QUALITY PROTEIN: hypothetical protein Cgig2_004322 [Carnegiea gigantea]|uniref:DUF4283 domain-containing protein n=1 Tax=Carnegiea gigantea TaxID=171969 RepID=A0A9Q1GR90_9CARY|nr:LOW QUALITY PROTEIN: hypothetical protein Cgig2_004322 [Carnegiea gigantea]